MELGRFRLVGHGWLALERGRGVARLVRVKAQRTGCTKAVGGVPGLLGARSGFGRASESWVKSIF